MQSYTEIPSSRTLSASLGELLNNDKTALSCSSGTAFPTINLQVGMLCFRTDLVKLYQLVTASPADWRLIMDVSSGIDTQLAAKLNAGSYTAADVLAKLKTVDGSGSGVDADLLDGNHASAFATSGHNHDTTYLGKTAKAADSDLLDGYHASSFVRSVNGSGPDANGNTTVSVDLSSRVAKSGDTMTGNLTIQNTAPTINMQDVDNVTRYLHVNGSLMGFLKSDGNWDMYMNNGGSMWTANYGWLHDRFANANPILGQAGTGDHGVRNNCGNINCNTVINCGYEVFNAGGGQHQLRYYIEGYNVSWNCNCNCDCAANCACGNF